MIIAINILIVNFHICLCKDIPCVIRVKHCGLDDDLIEIIFLWGWLSHNDPVCDFRAGETTMPEWVQMLIEELETFHNLCGTKGRTPGKVAACQF